MEETYTYYIPFTHVDEDGVNFAASVLTLGGPIDSIEAIEAVCNNIGAINDFKNVVILSWSLIENPVLKDLAPKDYN